MRAIITLILMHFCLQPARSEKTYIFISVTEYHS